MIALALALLTAAVAGGAVLFVAHLRGRRVPAGAGYAHAALAVTGTLTLAVAVFGGATPRVVNAALLGLAFALLGGVFVLLFRLQGERPPLLMVALHALFGGIALALLAIGAGVFG